MVSINTKTSQDHVHLSLQLLIVMSPPSPQISYKIMYSLYVDISGLADGFIVCNNRLTVHHLRESPDLKQRPSGVDDKLGKAVDYEKLQGTQRFLTIQNHTLHKPYTVGVQYFISNTILVSVSVIIINYYCLVIMGNDRKQKKLNFVTKFHV